MRVTIVLPCYNAAAHLERCFASLFAQTHGELDLIAVDDGSSDDTLALLHALAPRAPFPMEVIAQANAGACAARNAGWRKATGSYIQFMDADDELVPQKIAHQVALAEHSGLPELIVGSVHTYKADGNLRETDAQSPDRHDPWLDLMKHRMGGTPGNLWKRSAVEEVGGWDPAMKSSQEYDLMFRMLCNGARPVFDPEVLTHVHLRASGSVSTSNLDQAWERFIELRARIIAHLQRTQPALDLQPHRQVLFDSIRTLYPFAPERSVELYTQLLPKDFAPALSPATGRGYLALHKLLGFALANRVRQWFSPRASAPK
ncbi:MAG: glycosyltransferase family 2 protein [Flavobacteriales bacterium]|nr:glycosyltransferase family 2 protein [Flavobacteriales bacterium]